MIDLDFDGEVMAQDAGFWIATEDGKPWPPESLTPDQAQKINQLQEAA